MTASRGCQREPAHSIQPHRRSILAEQYLRHAGRDFPALVIGRGHLQMTQIGLALELPVLGMDDDLLSAAEN